MPWHHHTVEKARRPSNQPAVRVADDALRKVTRAVRRALERIQNRATLAQIATAAERGRVSEVLEALGLDVAMDAKTWEAVVAELRSTLERGALAALDKLPKKVALEYHFDIMNPKSVEFIRGYKLDLVKGLTAKTREGVTEALVSAFKDGMPPAALARQIKPMIGLTGRDARQVNRFRAGLQSSGAPAADVARRAQQLSEQLTRRRAMNIARTETIRAASEGQRLLWQDAAQAGYVSRQARMVWVVTPDDRLCPVCEAIPDMNEGGVPLGGMFSTSVGPVTAPPAHPSCRCGVVIEDARNADMDRAFERQMQELVA